MNERVVGLGKSYRRLLNKRWQVFPEDCVRQEEQSFTQNLALSVLAWFLSVVFSGTEYRTVLLDTLKTLHSSIKRKLGLRILIES